MSGSVWADPGQKQAAGPRSVRCVAHEEELSSGFWMVSSNETKTLRAEGGGFSSCDVFTQYGVQKNKKKQ